jgi:hypothetical protein
LSDILEKICDEKGIENANIPGQIKFFLLTLHNSLKPFCFGGANLSAGITGGDLSNGLRSLSNGQEGSSNGLKSLSNGQGNSGNGMKSLSNGQGGLSNGQGNSSNGMKSLSNGQGNSSNGLKSFSNGQGTSRPQAITVREPIIKSQPNISVCRGNTPVENTEYKLILTDVPEHGDLILVYNPEFYDFPLRMCKKNGDILGFTNLMYKDRKILIGPFFDLCLERQGLTPGNVIVSSCYPDYRSKWWKIKDGKITDPSETVALSIKWTKESCFVPVIVPFVDIPEFSCNWMFV